MCLAVPGQVLEIVGDDPLMRIGKVAFAGIVKEASLALLPDAGVGDYVLVHAGFAITLLDQAEAQRTLDYLEALGAVSAPLESTDAVPVPLENTNAVASPSEPPS
jgi:hydrogenase expression/formation protein HypC